MEGWAFPDPRAYGFDQVNVEPLGTCSIVRCIRRCDGSKRQVVRIIVPYPYALMEAPMKELLGHFGEVTPFDNGKIIAWGLRLYIDNSQLLRLGEQRRADPKAGLDVTALLPPNSWVQGPKAAIRRRKRG